MVVGEGAAPARLAAVTAVASAVADARVALTNAASIAGLLLTTEALVTNLDKDESKRRRVEGSVR